MPEPKALAFPAFSSNEGALRWEGVLPKHPLSVRNWLFYKGLKKNDADEAEKW